MFVSQIGMGVDPVSVPGSGLFGWWEVMVVFVVRGRRRGRGAVGMENQYLQLSCRPVRWKDS